MLQEKKDKLEKEELLKDYKGKTPPKVQRISLVELFTVILFILIFTGYALNNFPTI